MFIKIQDKYVVKIITQNIPEQNKNSELFWISFQLIKIMNDS